MVDPAIIKESLVLSEIIGQSVKLRRSGSSGRFIGLCPFHSDRNPSFCVDDNWGRYKCFSCGKTGDAIQYLQDSYGLDFKGAIQEAKSIAGIQDEYMTPAERRKHETKVREAAAERAKFRKWKEELRYNLICYTSLEWEMYRKARRQLLDTWTQELEVQAELAFLEADRKERALDQFESCADSELLGYFRTRKIWEGVMNPPWFLSGKRLELVKAKGV